MSSPQRRVVAAVALSLLTAAGVASPAAAAGPTARGSAEQVQVTGAKPGAKLVLERRGSEVAVQRAGRLGAAVFRDVAAGAGYRVRSTAGASRAVRVLTDRPAPPTTTGYRQKLPEKGYGYLTTRDGTKLAINVQLPAGAKAPYPTLVEYSGYGYADPKGGESSIAQIGNLLGYAVVSVNMRGTGCSGGAFDYFERLQALDGYDVVETVARQPWALHRKVGMMGISYGGISQLFVGATRPPSLAAITPLSVLDKTQTTLYPGGILNTGFALAWAKDRVDDGKPATATTGQRWAYDRIREGDRTCRDNQALHAEAVDLLAKNRANAFYRPSVADPLSPSEFVDEIRTPVFLACQWQDEQTGGHCPTLASRFTGTKKKWFTFTNGVHIDSLDPATFVRWYDFLELYVARRAPNLPKAVRDIAPVIFQAASGVSGVTLPEDPIQGRGSYTEALAAFEALPSVRVLFNNGAGTNRPAVPVPGYEESFARWPVPGTQARTWHFGPGGTLGETLSPPGADAFTWDPAARPAQNFSGNTGGGAGGLWTAPAPYRWQSPPAGTAVSYVSTPFSAPVTVIGAGAVSMWVRASEPDVDLQATISEVRPDGRETFVQSGWLRASRRKLDGRRSTQLEPEPTFRRGDAAPLPRGRWTHLKVPLYYQGHPYRVGSRLRVTISAPGGDQPVWSFGELVPSERATVTIARSRTRPSRLTLPVVPGLPVRTGLPACEALRGQPCRDYVPSPNREDAALAATAG